MNNPINSDGGTVYVIGAGLAGLGAAVRLAKAGQRVRVFEAANQAGGRCRSFFDTTLDRVIDNGNHLVLGGNRGVFDYLDDIGAGGSLSPLSPAAFPFIDIRTGERWTIRPSPGRVPWWIFSASRRVPGSVALDYLRARRLKGAAASATVADCLDPSRPIFDRFWQPLSRAVLNTDAAQGSARLLWPMLEQTLLKGADHSRPYLARDGLSTAFVDPALAFLKSQGVDLQLGRRLRKLDTEPGRVARLGWGGEDQVLSADDQIILAVPPSELAALIPEIAVPAETRAIVNLHFRIDTPIRLPDDAEFLGLIGTTAQWVFARGDVVSVTVSDAGALADRDAGVIANEIWAEIAGVLECPAIPVPPVRVIKEHRATLAQTPAEIAKRPPPETPFANLFLAGDWIDTGLPASINGALRSGYRAAALATAR